MAHLPLREIEGAKDLVQDTVETGVLAVADVHLALAQQTYDLLALVPPIAAPVRAVERMHLGLTRVVCVTLLAASRLAGALADEVIEQWAKRDALTKV